MCISPEQERKKEAARRQAIQDTYDVCADGEKHKGEYDKYSNQIDNE